MIKVNVLSEEKSWTKKIKKKREFFSTIYVNFFPGKFQFLNKKILYLIYYFQIIKILKN